MFVFLTLIAFAIAEPPVGDSYALARSSHDHVDLSRSVSQEYGNPLTRNFPSRNSIQDYPNARSSPSQLYGAPNSRRLSQDYGTPNLRNAISDQYGPPSSRFSQGFNALSRGNPSQEYGAPATRLSQEYGSPKARLSSSYTSPNLRSGTGYAPSDSYSAPQERSSPSSEYGVPDFRSTPSEEYGPPIARSFSSPAKNPSQTYGAPSFRNQPSQNYGEPSARSNNAYSRNSIKSSSRSFGQSKGLDQSYGAPRSLSSQYGVPDARNVDSYSRTSALGSQGLSGSYGVPSARGLSQEYGAPLGKSANLKTNAFASQFGGRSPSTSYGPPAARDSMPSEQYGVPDQFSSTGQGYNYARDALDEILSREPANYDFAYKVNDFISGSDFGHTETRQENKAEGSYFVVLPDGTKQVVEYEADERGFKPRISVEPADVSRSGYDDNAADLARSGDGPY